MAEGNRIRTALLAAVSHDLRTPLASIKASVTSLRSDDVAWSEEDEAELLAGIEAGAAAGPPGRQSPGHVPAADRHGHPADPRDRSRRVVPMALAVCRRAVSPSTFPRNCRSSPSTRGCWNVPSPISSRTP
ncbi:histidine kinase dimerization/phospho-acceptor domain-containing protein [Streptomyces inhibens]|uniref:histidine kinase dimerization/phospho-acceptor domain-containing protein n=1 Tax=Streptomyces inhibens TaxID=2293571 RepID=UPI00402A75D1